MAGFGLLLGGGGSVGIAWENGVLAGLVDAIGFEPAKSRVIVGTSAGSAVGADMALGKDPHDALALDRDAANPRRSLPPPDLERGAFAEIIALMSGRRMKLRNFSAFTLWGAPFGIARLSMNMCAPSAGST